MNTGESTDIGELNMLTQKKLLGILASIAILASLLSAPSIAAGASSSGDFVVENGVLTDYTGPGGDVVIPGDIGITEIGEAAFYQYDHVYSVVIPDGVTSIGDDVFSNCHELTTINLPNGLTTIGSCAFIGCHSLKSINIPDSVTSIGHSAFVSNAFTTIKLPKHLKAINEGMFVWCSKLTSVTIPDGVTSIGYHAFYGCTSLMNIDIPSSVTSIGYAVFENTCIPNPILVNNNSLLCYVPSHFTNYTIPDTVTKLSGGSFSSCSKLKTITIPPRITEIGQSEFLNCTALSSVILPDTITSIGDDAFSNCTALSSIILPDTVTSIGNFSFYGCKNLITLNIPRGVETIGVSAFSFTGLKTSILIDNGRTLCFVPSDIKSYSIPNTVKKISGGAFANCESIIDITIPDGVTTIDLYAFSFCNSLASVTISEGVTTIGDHAFSECQSLTRVKMPESVTDIGDYAFEMCHNLTSINLSKKLTKINCGLFFDCEKLGTIILPENITSIGAESFCMCNNLTSVKIPQNTTSIGDAAFLDTNLSSIYIYNRSTKFGEAVFKSEDSQNENLTIYGLSSSTADIYAKENYFPFVSIDKTAQPVNSSITVNEHPIALQAYNIDGDDYFKLRDLAMALNEKGKQFNVAWDEANKAILIISKAPYSPVGGELASSGGTSDVSAVLSSATVCLDGKEISLTAYTINGNNYFKPCDVGQALNFGVTRDESGNTIKIDTSTGYSG